MRYDTDTTITEWVIFGIVIGALSFILMGA